MQNTDALHIVDVWLFQNGSRHMVPLLGHRPSMRRWLPEYLDIILFACRHSRMHGLLREHVERMYAQAMQVSWTKL